MELWLKEILCKYLTNDMFKLDIIKVKFQHITWPKLRKETTKLTYIELGKTVDLIKDYSFVKLSWKSMAQFKSKEWVKLSL